MDLNTPSRRQRLIQYFRHQNYWEGSIGGYFVTILKDKPAPDDWGGRYTWTVEVAKRKRKSPAVIESGWSSTIFRLLEDVQAKIEGSLIRTAN